MIKGFKNREGNLFDAALKLINGEVKFDFQKEALANCPLCNVGQIVETAKAFSCDQWRDSGCKFTIWKTIASRKITKADALTLVQKKKQMNWRGLKVGLGIHSKPRLF